MKPTAVAWPLLLFAAATHFLVDATAGTLSPLWPRLPVDFHLVAWQSAGMLFLWQMTTSLSQLVFGVLGDRFNTRWLLWTGPLLAVVCLGSIGLSRSPAVLAILLVISGLAIAAFHPEGAALAGQCGGAHRSRAMSVFTVGGFIGQAVGPVYGGKMVDWWGLSGLMWGIPVGLGMALLILPLGRSAVASASPRLGERVSARAVFQGRGGLVALVLAVGSLRIIAASGVPVMVGFLLDSRATTTGEIGMVQSAFMFGIGLGGLACATMLKPHHEWPILWICPCLVTPVLLAIPWTTGPLLSVLVCLSGLLLGTSLPVLVSLGQQLMPDSTRVASSITMGVSWGIGGASVSLILAACQTIERYEPAFVVFAIATALSSLLGVRLPRNR